MTKRGVLGGDAYFDTGDSIEILQYPQQFWRPHCAFKSHFELTSEVSLISSLK